MISIKYINHIYGKQGLETERIEKHRGEIISDNGIITILKSSRYSYFIENKNILEVTR